MSCCTLHWTTCSGSDAAVQSALAGLSNCYELLLCFILMVFWPKYVTDISWGHQRTRLICRSRVSYDSFKEMWGLLQLHLIKQWWPNYRHQLISHHWLAPVFKHSKFSHYHESFHFSFLSFLSALKPDLSEDIWWYHILLQKIDTFPLSFSISWGLDLPFHLGTIVLFWQKELRAQTSSLN